MRYAFIILTENHTNSITTGSGFCVTSGY